MSADEKFSQQASFNMGVVTALHALKTALQASPGFNNDALVQVVKSILNNPSSQVHAEEFNAPLIALLHDHILDENGNLRTEEVSLN